MFQFTEDSDITVVGGADNTVGAVGGWLQVRFRVSSLTSSILFSFRLTGGGLS